MRLSSDELAVLANTASDIDTENHPIAVMLHIALTAVTPESIADIPDGSATAHCLLAIIRGQP